MVVIGTISFTFLIVAYAIYFNYQNTLDKNYDKFADMLTNIVSNEGVERLSARESAELKIKTFVDNVLTTSEDIAGIEFYDARGELIYQGHNNLPQDQLKA